MLAYLKAFILLSLHLPLLVMVIINPIVGHHSCLWSL
ncbi:hypothetical protein BLA29_012299 [Euroglyphus maynei]|uniref:Uncharacterized protein n=1 Tax=Euroglyphus maynei TaxID=6958 RepID=A0A1Y3BH52_EURMA|nr:hypothetical protein BLA29_012299 [Euroglyphus maynei]